MTVATLLRTMNVNARTVPDRLQNREPITTQCG